MQSSRAVVAASITALVTLAGCSASPFEVPGGSRQQTFLSEALLPADAFSRPVRAAAAPVEHDGILYSAAVVPSEAGLEAGPMSLRVVVHVLNPADSTVRLDVEGCTVWPEFRRSGSTHSVLHPHWTPYGQCAHAPYIVEIAAGATHSLSFLAYDVMLAHALEDGRYDVTALFRLRGTTLRLDAGTADVRLMVPNLAFHVGLEEQHGRPTARVRVENRNPVPVRLEWGHCAVGFELHAHSDHSDAPQQLERERLCLDYLATGVIAPGETLDAREFTYTAQGARNPDVRPGTYHVVVTLRMNWRTYRFPMGTLVVR
jgi:hypothetical protein